MDSLEELSDLIAQAKEHLIYYQELGLTNAGEIAPVTAARESSTPVIIPPPEFPQKLTIDMPSNHEDPLWEPELFSENEPRATMTQVANEEEGETLEDVRRDLGDCRRCKLFSTRTTIVFGEGAPKAELMFVGEGPGADEDASGRPFVGRAGQLLTKMIDSIDLKREEVYIANVVKSRPPGNRAPESDEVKACIPFLFRQIAAIRPKLIVTLGNPAMQALLDTKIGITKMRGNFQDYPRIAGVKVMPTFHPAYLLRWPDKKRDAWEDLKKVRAFLRGEL